MRGQNEVLIFVLLFVIGIALFTSATVWSRGIFQQNIDVARVESSEKFMKELNDAVLNIIKFGGSQEMEYNLDGTIELLDDKTIEVKVPVNLPLSSQWVNISSDTFFIQEKLEGDMLRIQLNCTQSNYKVEFFTEGPRLAKPDYLSVERNSTYDASSLTVIKIKITFY
jgi:hypothetical protein